MTQPRTIKGLVPGQNTSDGAGVKLKRLIGTQMLPDLDPFLLLDEFSSDSPDDYLAGFPNHPHRGFETVTYMLNGRMRHRDNKGNEGLLESGDVQWMTAGSGLIHSEMPEQEQGLMRGFQLWVNLPRREKMKAPRYQDIASANIPVVSDGNGNSVKVIAGRYGEATGPVDGVTLDPLYLDITLAPGQSLTVPVPKGHNALVNVFEGAVSIGGSAIAKGNMAVLKDGDAVTFEGGSEPGRFLLIAGQPLLEPVVRYGPFVMNSSEEIAQAVQDYQAGLF
ncbi:pirin family protein [Gallaecimonas pentaromativorans]|uniref:pirin family protein n=1 Tax=Gallaecimonas pentaromativorans TaxID=584787 RepID=UPI00067EDAFB|nr:pirin family protein [Gallaecimonas pentaromativorans]MED5526953.1 pirin family protein [Pseudomonadota bacterium]